MRKRKERTIKKTEKEEVNGKDEQQLTQRMLED
jgi:hypothetical protein